MTREEAIKCLKTIQQRTPEWDYREDGLSYWDAIDMALSALRPVSREQVEKVFPGCEYCTNNIKSRKEYITKEYPGLCDFEVFLDGSRTPSDIAVITYNHQTPFTEDICFSFPVLYCPHCGRPLTDEAVDIRLKELEALNDGKGD